MFAVLFALLALGALIVIPYLVLHLASDLADLRIPLLALSGFLGVFAAVALLVLAFKAMNLTDVKQALGMPEGSVRALIAIFLIVTLGMSALFLLGPQRSGQGAPPADKTSNENNNSTSGRGSAGAGSGKPAQPTEGSETSTDHTPQGTGTVSAIIPSAPLTGMRLAALRTVASSPSADKNPSSGANAQTASSQPATAGAGQDGDLAKQFFTLVGGLVTTVVGFYFGSQTANSAAAKGARAATDAATAAATHATTEAIRAMR